MNAQTREISAQNRFEFDVMYGKIVMHHKVKDLLKENVALNILTNLEKAPIHTYIDRVSDIDKYARKARNDLDIVISNSEDMLQELQNESDIKTIMADCFYERMSFIFDLYFVGYYYKKYAFNEKEDEHGVPDYFPLSLKNFLKTSYLTFKQICAMKEGDEFIDLIEATPNEKMEELSYVNRALILTKIFLGKIRCGRNITRILFDRIPKETKIPETFLKLCRIKNGNYFIFNTDSNTLNFQLAAFDLIPFVDFENKKLFKNKINQYLKNCKNIDGH